MPNSIKSAWHASQNLTSQYLRRVSNRTCPYSSQCVPSRRFSHRRANVNAIGRLGPAIAVVQSFIIGILGAIITRYFDVWSRNSVKQAASISIIAASDATFASKTQRTCPGECRPVTTVQTVVASRQGSQGRPVDRERNVQIVNTWLHQLGKASRQRVPLRRVLGLGL